MAQRLLVPLLVFMFTLSGAAQADALADVKAKGKLICGHTQASEPFGYPDQTTRQFVGFDVDICRALAKGLGVDIELKALSISARIPELKTKRVDVLAALLGYSAERATQVDYSYQYYLSNQKAMVKESSGLKSIKDLAGRKLGGSKGSSSVTFAQKILPTANILTYQDSPSAYLALQQDKVEAVLFGELILARFVKQAKDQGQAPVEIISEPLFVEPQGIGVNKGETALLAAINNILLTMDGNGELQNIFDTWLGKKSAYDFVRSYKVEPIQPK
ncbi:MAG: ABC transporter substrate-binding protein [Alcaligenaceae bacterium]|nr:MAG: ABC transporter substrate-binding protein [Alcaligenaceae bacterium]